MDHDFTQMEARLHRFDRTLRSVETVADVLIPVIHRPGWTTLAETAFFEGYLDAMTSHATMLAEMRERLVELARLVAAEQNPLSVPLPPDHTRL